MHFLQHKFTEEDQLTMKFDLSNKLIEIRFRDSIEEEGRSIRGKIEIPCNE